MGFSSWGSWALEYELSSCGAQAQLPRSWNLPGPGIEPMSPVLAVRFLTTGLPEKSFDDHCDGLQFLLHVLDLETLPHLLLLLLLSRFSRVRISATPQTAAHQAPPSLGFSRQEHWSGLPFPSPMHESEK